YVLSIGKLHSHILALQISEATAKRKQLQSDNDLAKQKALLLRAEQKLDEFELADPSKCLKSSNQILSNSDQIQ
ncbi:unnamed protein product, partial [Rotaria sp. Silwood2]